MDPSWPRYQLPKANRKILFEFYCQNLEKAVKYFKAQMEDLYVIAEIRAFEMMPLNPMTERMKDLFKETLPTADIKEELEEGLSVIVAIDDYAIGFSTGFRGQVKESDEIFVGFKADYAEDCNALTKVPAEARMIKVMIKELRKVVKFHIPIGPYYSISRISIQKEFLGHGFGKILWRESMRLAKKNGIFYAQAECSAVNSTKLAESVEKWNKTVLIYTATHQDVQIVARFFAEIQMQEMPFTQHLNLPYEPYKEVYIHSVKDEVESGISLLAVLDNHLIGILTAVKEEVKPDDLGFTGIKEDYAQVVDEWFPNLPSDLQIVLAASKETLSNMKHHIPVGPYIRISRISVQKEFGHHGIGRVLWTEALKLAKSQGFEWAAAECSAVNSTKIANKLGLATVFTLPFDKIIFHGQQAFPSSLADGTTGLNLVVGKIDG